MAKQMIEIEVPEGMEANHSVTSDMSNGWKVTNMFFRPKAKPTLGDRLRAICANAANFGNEGTMEAIRIAAASDKKDKEFDRLQAIVKGRCFSCVYCGESFHTQNKTQAQSLAKIHVQACEKAPYARMAKAVLEVSEAMRNYSGEGQLIAWAKRLEQAVRA